jgi:SAM-dependent methyltransferase
VSSNEAAQPLGTVFDTVAREYDAHRPTYPDELVDRACGDLAPGDSVLEVGCGTGQLTRSLVSRGFHVTAIDPGDRLLRLAAEQVHGVDFVNATFEAAELCDGAFHAVFSASAFHWVDPDVGWSRAAATLCHGGTLALLQHCGVIADDDQAALMQMLRRVAPEVGATWPRLRPLEGLLAGIEKRRANVSDVWSWVGQYDLGRPECARLFGDVRAATVTVENEYTGVQLHALLRTLSPYHRMTSDQQDSLERSIVALENELGRAFRSTTAAILVTARKLAG